MIMERRKIKDKLTPPVIRMRRARFLMRHMIPIEYHELGSGKRLRLLVSPMNFLYQLFDPSMFVAGGSYDHYRVMDERKKISRELRRFSPRDDALGQATA